MKTNPLTEILAKACEGLVFTSETDARLEPYMWDKKTAPTPAGLVKSAGMAKGTPVETMELIDFFRAVPKADKAKFGALTKALHENLSNIQVYKVGDVRLRVYILGKTKANGWAGLTTEVVET